VYHGSSYRLFGQPVGTLEKQFRILEKKLYFFSFLGVLDS
jgi:hypothetical protein